MHSHPTRHAADVNAALFEVKQALLAPMALQDISRLVLEWAQRLTDSPWGLVGYADLHTGHVACPLAVTASPESSLALQECLGNVCEWVVNTSHPLVADSPAALPPCFKTAPEVVRYFVAVPALATRVTGVVMLANARRAYTEQDMALVKGLASLYALAVQREQIQIDLRLRDAAVQAAANAIVITDQQGRIMWINPAFTRLTGYTAAEVIGQTMRVLKSGQQDLAYYRTLWTTITNGEMWRGQLINRRKDGSLYIEEQTITPVRDERGEISHFIAIKQDVTERERAEQAVRIKDSAIASSINGIAFADLDGNLTYVNEAFLKLWGYDDAAEVVGRPLAEFWQEPSSARAVVKELRQQGRWTGELVARRRDRSLATVQLAANLITDSQGKPALIMGAFMDMTERVRIENELSRMVIELKRSNAELERYTRKLEEANRLKDLFTDIMRHDLLNPAGVISALANLLDTASNKEVKQIAASIRSSVARLIEMIEAASAYARLESADQLEKSSQDLGQLVKRAADSMAPALADKSMTLRYLPQGEFPARVNPIIENVFANLISNAIKYSPRERPIEIAILDHGDCYHAYVKDWGYGIPAEDKPHLFTRFQRVDRMGVKGTGLGLAIARRVLELHGGRIWIEDNPEGGSIFLVEIPKE